MKSPRFDSRAAPLRKIFSAPNLERVWQKKIRVAMRNQYLNDGIEHFDFHTARKLECQKLSRLILEGNYSPNRAQRILLEKSKGLCRQLVIPTPRDALVLQCLSDALYKQIRGKEPTKRAFFEPQENNFSNLHSNYGTFASWINFQSELFNFSKQKKFIVVTDIANYYDSISYIHLRNVISSITDVQECIIDMLIYILSDLLWQPDYMPRIEVGLPQINLDAPRLLAHCFLYELDTYLDSNKKREFVRFMDDIDIGVDNIIDAKKTLKDVDLVLQTKQVRLNSGKTIILTQEDALKHFRVLENARLDRLRERITNRKKFGKNLDRDRRIIQIRIRRGLSKKIFDTGNGEKILKRWINLASQVHAKISPQDLKKIILLRPSVRENIFSYLRRQALTPAQSKILGECAQSGAFVDNAAMVSLANHLVETMVLSKSQRHSNILKIICSCDPEEYFGLYCRLWLQSKFDSVEELFNTIQSARNVWVGQERLGRLIGSFYPLFLESSYDIEYQKMLIESRNIGFRDTCSFHFSLLKDASLFNSMFHTLKNPNPSRGTKITHPKFLCLLSALKNENAQISQKKILKDINSEVFNDIYYRGIARRLKI